MRRSRQLRYLPLQLGFAALAAFVPVHEAAPQAHTRLLHHAAYQRLDSLELAALTGATSADRLHAVQTIASIAGGQGDCVHGPAPTVRYPGLVSRLATIYRRSHDTTLRHAILDKMLWVVECDEAVAFLAAAAQEVPPAPPATAPPLWSDDTRGSLQGHAVGVLAYLGPRGEATLRRLHGEGTVRDSSARASLEALSRQGFHRSP